ncbi:hypothetical protein MRX96_057701 [Rhipicephalus microplus]
MLRVTKAKHRLFHESRQRDQLLRGLQLQILHSKAFMYCKKVALWLDHVPRTRSKYQRTGLLSRTATGRRNLLCIRAFLLKNSQERNHHKRENNLPTRPTQGAKNCQVCVAPTDEIQLHINDEDWDIVMGPLV